MPWEIRWFLKGMIPIELNNWFINLHGKEIEIENRLDYYFPKKKNDFVGVKLRGDDKKKLECKWRFKQSDFSHSEKNLVGILENWDKWSWKSDPTLVNAFTKFCDGANSVVKIEKKRKQLKFKIKSKKKIEPVDRIEDDERGGAIELTQLNAKNQDWWTLAVELVEKDCEKEQGLRDFLEKLLSKYSGPDLQKDDSYGYAKWAEIIQFSDD